MVELFKDLPEAVQSTVNIAARCNYLSQKVDPLLPIFECPEGKTQDEFITEQAYKGLKQRMEAQVYNDSQTPEERAEIDKRYYERLDYELSVIKKWVFPVTFLSCRISSSGQKPTACRWGRGVVPVRVRLLPGH